MAGLRKGREGKGRGCFYAGGEEGERERARGIFLGLTITERRNTIGLRSQGGRNITQEE